MTLTANATAIIKVGHFFTAPTSTAPPTSYLAPATPWVELGHTSFDNIFSLSSQGGDKTTVRTLQASTLRETIAARTESFAIVLEQLDQSSLKLYFGSNATYDTATKLLWVPDAPVPTQNAFLAVFQDGGYYFAIYAANVSITRGDDLAFGDGSSLVGLPLVLTPLSVAGNAGSWAITPIQTAP